MNSYVIFALFITTAVRHVSADGDYDQGVGISHRAWNLLDSLDCGFFAGDRIIGGLAASLGQFPWLVRLGYMVKNNDNLQWMCGGVLITDHHVLTAAHCVITPEYNLTDIRVGEYDTESNPDCQRNMCAPPVQDKKVKRILVAPEFNKPPLHNDIAIVEIDTAELNEYVTPICLPREEQEKPKEGDLVTVAGWGKINITTYESPTILQHITLPVLKTDACTFGKGFKPTPNEIVCAGAELNKDTCVGDSGGSLMKVYDTEEGPKTFAVGVVSFGPVNCGIKKPGVYSSVIYHLKWILDSII